MFEEFIRGRTYYTRSKQSVIDRKPTIKRVAKLKRKIQASITRSFFVKGSPRIKRQKTLSNSYSRRFILPNKLSLLKRTMYFEPRLFFEYQEEDFAFDKLRQNLRRYEANKMLSSVKGFQSSIKMLADKAIFFGRVYLTHKRRNTFITISDFPEYGVFANQRIVYKSSCGLQAYSGPKRSTPHARMSVAKAAGAFLRENEYTSIDLVFPSKYGRFFTRFVRTISENLYVRYIQISKRRPHSLGARKKKKRRL